MTDKFDELMYRAGITAQGCWDEMDGYDRDAILNFAELIVRECALVNFRSDYSDGEFHSVEVLKYFGVEE